MSDRDPIRADDLVDAELDRQAIQHLDFPLPCRVRRVLVNPDTDRVMKADERCGRPAEWLATCNMCGAFTYLCSACRTESLANDSSWCNQCKHKGRTAAMFRYQPLRGGA